MEKKVTLLILITLFLIASSAGAAGRPAVDFGTYNAPEEISKTVAALVPLADEGVEYLEVWLESLPATEDRLLTLEGQRLKLENRGGIYWVDMDPVAIPAEHQLLNDENTVALPLLVTFTVMPQDQPGEYRTVLVIREMGSEGMIKERRLPISLKIDPWVKIETTTGEVVVGSWGEEPGTLINRVPGEIRVASNFSWEIFLECSLKEELKSGDIELLLIIQEESGFEVLSKNPMQLKEGKILLGVGGPTILEDGYFWVKIPYFLKVKDYIKIPAGKFALPMVFGVRTVEE